MQHKLILPNPALRNEVLPREEIYFETNKIVIHTVVITEFIDSDSQGGKTT